MGKKPGDEAKLEVDEESRRYRIESIKQHTVAGPSAVADEDADEDADG